MQRGAGRGGGGVHVAARAAARARGGGVRRRVPRRPRGGGDQWPDAGDRMSAIAPRHFDWAHSEDGVGVVTLTGAERKNPLTFDSYAELRDTFRELAYADDVKAVVITGAEGNFCSGGDVRDIIGPLTEMDMGGLLRFTRMTGDLVKAIRGC